jgi:hypothetical protein
MFRVFRLSENKPVEMFAQDVQACQLWFRVKASQ